MASGGASWEGWIHKQGSLVPTWKKRYMVLKGRHIAYYDKEASNPRAKEKGTFTLAAVERNPEINHGLTLAGYDGKIMRIYTKTVGEFVLCYNAMTSACSEPEPKAAPMLNRADTSMSYRFERSSSSVNRAVTHSGWLEKEGQNVKSWKKRFFVLSGTDLTYYDRIGGTEKGGGRVVDVTYSYERRNSLTFVLNNDRILNVTADSEADMQNWYSAACGVLGKSTGAIGGASSKPIFNYQSPQSFQGGYGRASSREYDGGYNNGGNSRHYSVGSQGSSYSSSHMGQSPASQPYRMRDASSSSADSNQYDPNSYPSPPATYNPDAAADVWQSKPTSGFPSAASPVYSKPVASVYKADQPVFSKALVDNQAPVSPAFKPVTKPSVVDNQTPVSPPYKPMAKPPVVPVVEAPRASYDPTQAAEHWKAEPAAPSANLQSFLDKYMPADNAPLPVSVAKAPPVPALQPVAPAAPVVAEVAKPVVAPMAPVITPVVASVAPVTKPIVASIPAEAKPVGASSPVVEFSRPPPAVVEVTHNVTHSVTVNQTVVQNVTTVAAPITINVAAPPAPVAAPAQAAPRAVAPAITPVVSPVVTPVTAPVTAPKANPVVAVVAPAPRSVSSDSSYEHVEGASSGNNDDLFEPAHGEDSDSDDGTRAGDDEPVVQPLVQVIPKSDYAPEVRKPAAGPLYVDTAPKEPLWVPSFPERQPSFDADVGADDEPNADTEDDKGVASHPRVPPAVEIVPKSDFAPTVLPPATTSYVPTTERSAEVLRVWAPSFPEATAATATDDAEVYADANDADDADDADDNTDAPRVTPAVHVVEKSDYAPEVRAPAEHPAVAVATAEPLWMPSFPAPPVVAADVAEDEEEEVVEVAHEHVEGRCGVDCEHRVKAHPKAEYVSAPGKAAEDMILPPPKAHYRHLESDQEPAGNLAPLAASSVEPVKGKRDRKNKDKLASDAPKSCCTVM
ncbi:hypothetical protein ACHHYP_07977 [Achlya hypogyna]|uniref:PH domain-containing protein n=1 Tax=Achlya hypogyna TaxID=1202772 RepID=A0A1V9YQB1_ACHHY|nr:hypothetical protein ACHHYP_07977 [Achlya hypogyna]